LTVRDDGRGLPPRFEPAHDQGLGLQLIGSIARSEFSGSFWVEAGKPRGVVAHLVFPHDPSVP
jgi:two-component sensor histidine kinase